MAKGFLYAIELGRDCVKVGRSKNPEARLARYRQNKRKTGRFFITENMLENANSGETKVCAALKEHILKGREYFSCSFGVALDALGKVYKEEEKYFGTIAKTEPRCQQRSIGLDREVWEWLEVVSGQESRSVSAQIRRFLSKCKRELEEKK